MAFRALVVEGLNTKLHYQVQVLGFEQVYALPCISNKWLDIMKLDTKTLNK